MKSILFSISFLFLAFNSLAQFPGCPMVDAGPDETIDCSAPCVTLTATPFEAGATTSYSVGSIAYNPPVTFGQAGGTPVSVGTDDVWSGIINLPFDFCFYGQTYTSCVIGSNGAISFDLANANGYHPWSFTAPCPSAALAPAGNILGPYHDIDPSVGGSVQWYLLGTAPCRIFVVTFNSIPMFSCNNLSSSHMMVLYETTNAIDVYVDYRQTCASWNSGNAVIGIQDNAGVQGLAAPGRNTGPWAVSTSEGWRFTPDGAPIYTLEWLENGNVISTTDTVNVCPVTATEYVAQATYTSCNGTIIVETDTVMVDVTSSMTVTEVTNNPSSCGSSTGSVTVSASGGSGNYQYSFDDTLNFQGSGTFNNLPPGTYTVFAQDDSGCIGGVVITITELNPPTLTELNSQNSTCGLPNGIIEVGATGGTQPYDYTINGAGSQSNGTFNSLDSGTYELVVTDAGGCTDTLVITIVTTPFPSISLVSSDTTCANASNGAIEVSATGGTTPYLFDIDGGTQQSSGTFSNLNAGTYTLQVTDSAGCTDQISVEVFSYPEPSIFPDTFACNFGMIVNNTSSYSGGVWSSPDTAIHFNPNNTVDNPQIWTYALDGVYSVTFTDNQCGIAVTSIIDFYEYPHTWLADTFFCEGTEFNLVAPDNNPHPTTYEWNTGESGTEITITQAGQYIVVLNNLCHSGTDTLNVEYQLCDINAPNVISLAEGSQNSLWYVEADGLGEFSVFITNRWGNVVYECDDANANCYWDGRAQNGTFVNPGTYFYTIKAKNQNGSPLNKHGFITVVD